MYQKLLATLLFFTSTSLCLAQSKYTISGTVTDQKNGETIIGASINTNNNTLGSATNSYGFYSITLPEGKYKLTFKMVGYQTDTVEIDLKANVKLNKQLAENTQKLTEVTISLKKNNDNLTKPTMGTEILDMKMAAKLPVVFGEKDLVKTIQLMPGIKSNGEGSNGFSVRGGATDQNLILLDEAPVYNASHLLGMFSTFNSDAIKDATIIKGNSPAEFGGRLSSVLDVKMKEGNNKNYQLSGGIGLISSRLTVEGPIQKEQSSFIISGRRTYADLFAKLSSDFKSTKLYFYDLNAKANMIINDKNKLYFSGYFGKDVLSVAQIFGSEWGNATATLRWNSLWSSRLFANTSLIYSDYDFNVGFSSDGSNINFNSHIKDINLKQDFTFYLNNKNTLKFGINAIDHTITPTKAEGTNIINNKNDRRGLEGAVYASNAYKINNQISIDYGIRLSAYAIMGADTYNTYQDNQLINSIELAKGKVGKTYFNLEPRATLNYRINSTSSAKIGYALNTQNLHLMSNSTGGSPTDQWIGNSYNIKPELADQVSLGYSKNIKDNTFEFNTEVYYKAMQNQIDFRDGADINTVPDIESEILFGKGRAYGMEILFKKKTGRLTGWLGYTLSKTERQIDQINNGAWYAAKQDKTHDLSLVTVYELNQRWTLSGTFIYSTGNAVTFPTGKYVLNNMQIYQYGKRNADRMPATHRLDISATYQKPSNKRYQSSWNFGLYNVYGRKNPFSITFKENESNPKQIDAVQTSLFQWIPSATYNFKF